MPESSSHFLSEPSYHTRESRLRFTPFYVIVGVYRLCTDPNLYVPVWAKVKHGVRRGGLVGLAWTILTFNIQRAFVRFFLINSSRGTGLSSDTIFGYKPPINIATYTTVMFISSQVHLFFSFFLARNLRVARERAWDQTVKSRGKGSEFWGPYVEEWEVPPQVNERNQWWRKLASSGFGRFIIRRVLLAPLGLYPVVGIMISSWLKAVGTARYLHKPYFAAKKMTPHQTAVFMEERKWDYQVFGFVAALLEGLPIIGLGFSISNRIGAAMWAHDLEKRQHLVASGELHCLPPQSLQVPTEHTLIELSSQGPRNRQTNKAYNRGTRSGDIDEVRVQPLAGSWEEEEVS